MRLQHISMIVSVFGWRCLSKFNNLYIFASMWMSQNLDPPQGFFYLEREPGGDKERDTDKVKDKHGT